MSFNHPTDSCLCYLRKQYQELREAVEKLLEADESSTQKIIEHGTHKHTMEELFDPSIEARDQLRKLIKEE
jgi:hypothetical protein